ncbi:MAG TPA: thioredoxin domain-containing protein [Holophagaceae bacterium]|nr:thioredoxin domain-containing protein [Holophagaceae bacterium]
MASHLPKLLATSMFCLALSAAPRQEAKPAPPLQRQIDELRQSQERMQKDLDEIKSLLRERSGRVDAPSARRPPATVLENVFGEPFRGSASARVAILEYSDFDCSFCARYATTILPKIDADYIRTGKVKYFFRDLPMEKEHANALFKARMARCAGEQDKFWEMHDRLFAEQKPYSDMDLAALVHGIGLDAARFSVCINSDRYADVIRRSAAIADRKGISGTPAFLIGTVSEDGRLLTADHVFFGAESYEAFKKVLDELLAPGAATRH